MKKSIYIITFSSLILLISFTLIYLFTNASVFYSLIITFGTISYHFVMRLFVGLLINHIMKNKADYHKKWYQCHKGEEKFYRFIRIKKWKKRIRSFDESFFNPKIHSWDEIAQAMCQAEIVHEIIMVLSFVPIIFSIWFGELLVFIITSVISALIDSIFVMLQRYNRSRIIKLIKE